MRKKLCLFIGILLISCQEKKSEIPQVMKDDNIAALDASVAVTFINNYIENLNNPNGTIEMQKWMDRNPLVTESFKSELKKVLHDANVEDPELGLGFDPILDAQDYPEEGFEITATNSKTGVVTVAGKKWNDFKLNIMLLKTNNKWLVNGSGVVNVPEKLRALR